MARVIECWCCGRQAPHYRRELCGRCYSRWQRHGFQGPGPGPERGTASERAASALEGIRLHDSHLFPPPPGVLTARQAAERAGVSMRTIGRYKRALAGAS